MQRQLSVTFEGIDTDTPLNEHLSAKYKRTFAYHTIKDRLPVILTRIVDHLARDKEEIVKQYGQDSDEDIKSVIGKLSKLKNEVQTNKLFVKLDSNAEDVDDWNKYLVSLEETNEPPCWFKSDWLYAECYMYRRVWEIFETSKMLQEFDPFGKQKKEAYNNAARDVKQVGQAVLRTLLSITPSTSDLNVKFIELLKTCLWSNRCDLSLSNGADVEGGTNCLSNVELLNSCLLRDDSAQAWKLLSSHPGKVIDFVHDNAAYELFADLCLCDFLCTSSLASKIRLHVKRYPWYVSDVVRKDFDWLLKNLEEVGLAELTDRWRHYISDGTWTMKDEKYWTLPFDYSDMKLRDPQLYNDLSKSNLIIFKGDLNYRKLLGDINWDHNEKFETAIRAFHPTNILSLRTVKADLICGLLPGQSENLFEKDPLWMQTGEFGVIQFYQHH